MPTPFATTATAFEQARARASVANHFEATLLHTAIFDAREAGMSVRETARALRVPKSTVSRRWRSGRTDFAAPIWGNPDEYRAARAAILGDAQQDEPLVPFEWEDRDGERSVHFVGMGVARLGGKQGGVDVEPAGPGWEGPTAPGAA